MPGSPFMPEPGVVYNPDLVARLEEEYGLGQPVYKQFWIYFKGILQGDWGVTIATGTDQPVWEFIWEKVPTTLEMQTITTVLSSVLGIRAGVFSAVNQNNTKDTIMRFLTFVAYAMPTFWIAQILKLKLCIDLGWFPTSKTRNYMLVSPWYWQQSIQITGFKTIDTLLNLRFDLFVDVIWHLFLPVFCLTVGSVASLTRYVRSSMLEVMELDYVRSARAKGCKERDVINKHALRNSMIPTVTLIGMSFGFMITGSMLTERVFAINGMGRLYLDVIEDRDYFVIQAMVLLITGTVIFANLITDLLYGILDPRIRY
jgi:ABC-type dipeptide/oligopeptide/nickel transport system permease component